MTEQKRALVVDDSKSARLVLGRMLEKHALVVDTVESAAEALDFLTRNRPDVIFMDHMMPGMDGFEAVKAIKNNPETATIPVMMYTSKGGDLYVGQARALGAVGVLPKTVAPVELFESLRKLGLVKERRQEPRGKNETGQPDEDGTASERADDIVRHREKAPPVFLPADPPDQRPADSIDDRHLDQHLRSLLEEQRVEIRKDVLLSMENVSRQTASKLHKEVEEKLDSLNLHEQQTQGQTHSRLPVILMAGLLLLSLAWNYSIIRSQPAYPDNNLNDTDAAESSQARIEELESGRSEVLAILGSSWETTAWAMNQTMTYDYDEIALDGSRATTVEALLAKLLEGGFSGNVILQTHAGEFCLMGNQEEGFRLPAPDMPVSDCDFIGNPVQAADTPSAHQSLSFANFVASTALLSESSTITLEVLTLPRNEHLSDYPDKSTATAQSWNNAAHDNNRVLIRLEPDQ